MSRAAVARRGAAAALCALVAPAWAHSPSSGLKGFYAGVLHPWGAAPCALLLIALGLWLGQGQGRRACGPAGSAAATVAVLLAAAAGVLPALPTPVTLAAAMVLAALVIVDAPRAASSGPARSAGALLAPVALGLAAWAGGPDAALPPELSSLWMLAGMAAGCWLMPTYAALAAMALARRGWTAVGVRVIGAWIVAAALLVLALQWRPPAAG